MINIKIMFYVVLFVSTNLIAAIVQNPIPHILPSESVTYSDSMELVFNREFLGQELEIPRFNPSLGLLNSVNIQVSYSLSSAMVSVSNITEQPVNVELGDVYSVVNITYIGGALLGNIWREIVPISGELMPRYDTGDMITYEDFAWNVNNDTMFYSNRIDSKIFVGEGMVPMSISGGFFISDPSKGISVSSNNSNFVLDYSITYNYTVPEPAALSLLALGGLLLKRRR